MVYKCFVYGCKTHKLPKNTTFGVPKDPELRWRWAVALRPYSNGKELQTKHRVCKEHFRPEEIECFYNHLIQGTEVKIERGRPELKRGAIPSIFPGQKKPRRILVYKNEEKEKKTQSILLLNGEWVHLKKPDVPVQPTRKRINKTKFKKSSTAFVENKSSSSQLQEEIVTENVNEIPHGTETNKPSELESGHIESRGLSMPGLLLERPPDKETPSICINWDALPLPEEIGSLLCDSLVPHTSSSSDYQTQSPKSHSPPSPNNLSTQVSLPSEDIPSEQLSEEHLSTTDNDTENLTEEEETSILSFKGLLLAIPQIQLPSSMWGSHTDQTRVYFSFMAYTGGIAIPRVEKIVMYQGNMTPRVFLREIEVCIPVSERTSTSLEDVEEVLYQVDKLKMCLGIDRVGDMVSYSSDCDIFVEYGRQPRCPTCRKERSLEYSKKRYLETDSSVTSVSRSSKKKQTPSK